MHHTTPQDDDHWGKGEDVICESGGDISGFKLPKWVIIGDGFSRLAEASLDGRSGGQSFEAIPMVRADSLEWVMVYIMREAQVPHLEAYKPAQGLAVQDITTTDAGPYGEIEAWVTSLAGTPFVLSHGGCGNIHVHRHGHTQFLVEDPQNVGESPMGLGCGGDVTKVWRSRVDIHRAKRAQTDAFNACLFHVWSEERAYPFECFLWGGGGEAGLFGDLTRSIPNGTDEFRPAPFNSTV